MQQSLAPSAIVHGMSDQPTTRRRWFQFRLRTLLIFVTASAIFSAIYFIVWPKWQLYCEQADFEESVKQLKIGVSEIGARTFLRCKTATRMGMSAGSTAAGEPIVFNVFGWKNACYCVCYVMPRSALGKDLLAAPCIRLEVYRLPPAPQDYHSEHVSSDAGPLFAYIFDFEQTTFVNPQSASDIKRELIYSDPPK
jgi:hypothetical protein